RAVEAAGPAQAPISCRRTVASRRPRSAARPGRYRFRCRNFNVPAATGPQSICATPAQPGHRLPYAVVNNAVLSPPNRSANMKTVGYAAKTSTSALAPYPFERRALRPNDVAMEVRYCGVCHSDLHTARNDWGWTAYPAVPGHEIVGRVTAVGSEVTRYKIGDSVAV